MNVMLTRVLTVVAALAALSSLSGCVPVAAVGMGVGMASLNDRRTSGAQIEDEAIELRVNNRVSGRWGEKAHINITSYNRSVLLTGEVPDASAREQVEQMAAGVANVRSVTNELTVGAPSQLSNRSNDAFITSKIKARFVEAEKFNPLHVKVVTEAGTAYLLGIVTQAEADQATEIARTTAGVRRVVRIFEFCKLTDDVCRPPPPVRGDPPKSTAQ